MNTEKRNGTRMNTKKRHGTRMNTDEHGKEGLDGIFFIRVSLCSSVSEPGFSFTCEP